MAQHEDHGRQGQNRQQQQDSGDGNGRRDQFDESRRSYAGRGQDQWRDEGQWEGNRSGYSGSQQGGGYPERGYPGGQQSAYQGYQGEQQGGYGGGYGPAPGRREFGYGGGSVLDKIRATRAIRSKADGAAMNAVILAEILKAGIVERVEAITAILTSNMYVRAGQVNRSTLTIISGVRNKLMPWMRITATGETIATKSSLTSSASGAQSATLNAAATRAVVPVQPLVNKGQLARNINNPSLDVLIP